MIKIFKGEAVYIPEKEIKNKGISIPENLFSQIEGYGKVISEDSFNSYLADNAGASCFLENIELTKVQSLSFQMGQMRRIRPLKTIFLHGFAGMDRLEGKIKEEEKREKAKLIQEICSRDTGGLLDEYNRAVKPFAGHMSAIDQCLKEAGLSFQFMTEIGESRKPSLHCFLAGKDIFYSIYPDDWDIENYIGIKRLEDGSVEIPEPYEEAPVVLPPRESGRDFRKYSLSQNISWCFENLPCGSESLDYIDFHKDGISVSFQASMLMKMVNPRTFPELYFIEGILDFSCETVKPKAPEKTRAVRKNYCEEHDCP